MKAASQSSLEGVDAPTTYARKRSQLLGGLTPQWSSVLGRLYGPALAALGSGAGAIALNVNLPSAAHAWSVTQGFMLAAAALALGLRLARKRTDVLALMFGWYLGGLGAMAPIWVAFFGNGWGWPAWMALAALLALPCLLAPSRRPALGILPALILAAIPPLAFFGMANPLLTAGALFPGTGWLGLALTLAFFALSGFRTRLAILLQIVAAGWGMVHLAVPPPQPPADTWAATTYSGVYPEDSLTEGFKWQDRSKAMVSRAVSEGAKLVLTPETTNPSWDDGQAFYWKGSTALAAGHKAQVLVGVYTNPLQNISRSDGLVDLASGTIYPAQIPLPIAMWKPWTNDGFPLHLEATQLIPTAHGPAAHLVCYEELLMWPLMAQEAHSRPTLLLSIANQWFADGWLRRPQERSVAMQARLWGLPLLRAVNYAPLPN